MKTSEKLQALYDFAWALPRPQFDMLVLCRSEHIPTREHMCGTVGCLWGWSPVVFPELKYVLDDDASTRAFGRWLPIWPGARNRNRTVLGGVPQFLGITREEGGWLFMSGEESVPDGGDTEEVALCRLELLIRIYQVREARRQAAAEQDVVEELVCV